MNEITFAKQLAEKAGSIMRQNFTLGMQKEWKADNTPVTATDFAVNRLVIDEVKTNFPTHGILGEEESYEKERDFIWVCDPVDGTVPFSFGYPTFVFALALVHKGESILGVIYDPMLERMVYAEKGRGAYLGDKRIHVANETTITSKTYINVDADNNELIRKNLLKKDAYVGSLYSASYASLMVACGSFHAEIYTYSNPWDGASAQIIVEEAGGKVTSLKGESQLYNQKIHGFIASNGKLHDELVEVITTR